MGERLKVLQETEGFVDIAVTPEKRLTPEQVSRMFHFRDVFKMKYGIYPDEITLESYMGDKSSVIYIHCMAITDNNEEIHTRNIFSLRIPVPEQPGKTA